jgi:hypothetical protein
VCIRPVGLGYKLNISTDHHPQIDGQNKINHRKFSRFFVTMSLNNTTIGQPGYQQLSLPTTHIPILSSMHSRLSHALNSVEYSASFKKGAKGVEVRESVDVLDP